MHELRRPAKMRPVIYTAKEPFLLEGTVLFSKKKDKKTLSECSGRVIRRKHGSFVFLCFLELQSGVRLFCGEMAFFSVYPQ